MDDGHQTHFPVPEMPWRDPRPGDLAADFTADTELILPFEDLAGIEWHDQEKQAESRPQIDNDVEAGPVGQP
jgi:hypothetical protein